MHTIFINTFNLDDNYAINGSNILYNEFFEVPVAERRLKMMYYPKSSWGAELTTAKKCAREISEFFDCYKDVDGQFNLVLYANAYDYEDYIESENNDSPTVSTNEKLARHEAFSMLLQHYYSETLIRSLRSVIEEEMLNEVLFVIKKLKSEGEYNDNNGRRYLSKFIWEFLGLPCREDLCTLITGLRDKHNNIRQQDASDEDIALALEEVKAGCADIMQNEVISGVRNTYAATIDMIMGRLRDHVLSLTEINEALDNVQESLAETVYNISDGEQKKNIYRTYFDSSYRSTSGPERKKAVEKLEFSVFLLKCIFDEKLTSNSKGEKTALKVLKFDKNTESIAKSILRQKATVYDQLLEENAYSGQSRLVPKIVPLNFEHYAFNGNGDNDASAVQNSLINGYASFNSGIPSLVGNEDPETKKKNRSKKISDSGDKKSDKSVGNGSKGYMAMEAEALTYGDQLTYKCESFITDMSDHTTKTLSHYSDRNREGKAPLLTKRNIIKWSGDRASRNKSTEYVAQGEGEATDTLDVLMRRATNAYYSSVKPFLSYLISDTISAEDIKAEHEVYEKKIRNITKSLQNLKYITVGVLLGVALLYAPYLVIQGVNESTALLACQTVGIPLAIMLIVALIIGSIQKLKYYKTKKEFFDTVNAKVLQHNTGIVNSYDKYLNFTIPRLRSSYNYLYKIMFYSNCCDIASAKIKHHTDKLNRYHTVIGNIIENLGEYGSNTRFSLSDDPIGSATGVTDTEAEGSEASKEPKIDYSVSFCCNRKNANVYTIMNSDDVKTIYGKGGQKND